MKIHPSIQHVRDQLQSNALHAARSGREVMRALADVCADSQASSTQALCNEIEAAVDVLLLVLPAYAPPLNVMHAIMSLCELAIANGDDVEILKTEIASSAEHYVEWSAGARDRIARIGVEVIREGSTVFTFTLSETVMNTFKEACRYAKHFKVLVTESRPNLDGLITATQLAKEGISVEVSIDACIGMLIPRADIMLVGAEAVMADGTVVCKVGTYPAALVAHAQRIPVYVAVDTMKFNLTSMLGIPLRLEPIREQDISIPPCSNNITLNGHLFDQTPPNLIKALVTERGILSPKDCASLMSEMRLSNKLSQKLHAWAN